MKKKSYFKSLSVLLIIMVIGFQHKSFAQVKGISYTISPSIEHNWFNENSGIGNGYLGGAQLGLGFGELIELRGLYLQSFNLNTAIDRFGVDVPEEISSDFAGKDLDLKRYGAEMKLNLGSSALSPFLVGGSGIQSISFNDNDPNKQIYLSGGAGLQLSFADRFTFTFQGLRNSYRSNAVQQLLGEDDLEFLGLDPNDFGDTNYSSWAGRASLLLYLGGRRPGTYSDIDMAYTETFKKGFGLAIEPSLARMNFNDGLPYDDTYLAGLYTGFDFGPNFGIRGFYLQALEDGLSTSFDDLALLGAEARFRFGDGLGFTPFFSLGGGQIRSGEDLDGGIGLDDSADTQAFAAGGAGINVSLSPVVSLTLNARSLLTSSKDINEIESFDAISNSWMYGTSVNFVLGGNSNDESWSDYSEKDNQQMKEMMDDISVLDKKINNAILEGDDEKVKTLSEQRDIAIQRFSTRKRSAQNRSKNNDRQNIDYEEIRNMSDEEFIAFMDNDEDSFKDTDSDNDYEKEIKSLRKQIEDEKSGKNKSKKSKDEEEINKLKKELKALREGDVDEDDKEEGGKDLKEYKEEIDKLRKDLEEMRGNKNSDSADSNEESTFQNELKQLREELNSMKGDKGDDVDKNSEDNAYQKELKELRKELESIKNGNKKDNEKEQDDENPYKKELDELRKELGQISGDGRGKDSKDSDNQYRKELDQLRKELEQISDDGRGRDSNDKENPYQKEIDELKKELQSIKGGNKSAKDDNETSAYNKELEELRKQIENMKGEESEENVEDNPIQKELEALRQEIKQIQDGKKSDENKNPFQDELDEIREELEKLKLDNDSDMGLQDDQSNSDIVDLKKKLRQLESDNANTSNKDKLSKNNDMIAKLKEEIEQAEINVNEFADQNEYDSDEDMDLYDETSPRVRSAFAVKEDATGFFNSLRYNGASGIAGFNIGGNGSLNIGYRVHYIIDGREKLEFMPETYFGFAPTTNFGILANINYHLRGANQLRIKGIKPYFGAGAGIIKTGGEENSDQIRPVINLLVGSALDMWQGKLYVDFSTRNIFSYNQIVAGYKFPF